MTTWNVPDMSCAHCSAKIEAALTAADATAFLDFDMAGRKVDIDSTLSEAEQATLLSQAGFPATPRKQG